MRKKLKKTSRNLCSLFQLDNYSNNSERNQPIFIASLSVELCAEGKIY